VYFLKEYEDEHQDNEYMNKVLVKQREGGKGLSYDYVIDDDDEEEEGANQGLDLIAIEDEVVHDIAFNIH
jgi:hypothetical protein